MIGAQGGTSSPGDLAGRDGVRLVGVLSDTHGLLRPEALDALAGCELLVHAGDVGSEAVLSALGEIAPVVAVRGNMDHGPSGGRLRTTEVVKVGEATLYVLHDLAALDLDPRTAGFDAVVTGHTHRPGIERRNGVLYLNPGSVGPRRFTLPVTLALLRVRGRELEAELVELDV